jgi:hypothetical protein
MTEIQIETAIRKNYLVRNRRLAAALEDEPVRIIAGLQAALGRCAICGRNEHGGGLVSYKPRNGGEFLVGERCATYLDHLIAHRDKAGELLGNCR